MRLTVRSPSFQVPAAGVCVVMRGLTSSKGDPDMKKASPADVVRAGKAQAITGILAVRAAEDHRGAGTYAKRP
ncbi:hypothetical protein GCM10023096_67960 [Nonomuraea ferruginea]